METVSPMETTPTTPSITESYNWVDLPRDVTLIILMKLPPLEILESAQFVCKLWYKVSKDPSMWRAIHLHNIDEPELVEKHEKMVFDAVDRSAGGLLDLDIEGFGSDQLIAYVADRASQLKRLRIARNYHISADALIKAFEKLSSLEELELTLCSFSSEKSLAKLIRSCLPVRTFNLNQLGSRDPTLTCDDEALAIAESMHEVCHLQLIGNSMTNDGLEAILASCPHLQSLDLRACYLLDLTGNLGKRCSEQIKHIRYPYDSTEDYNFQTTDYDSDFDETYAAEYDEMDFVSDDYETYVFSDENDFSDDNEMDDFMF